ncbi:MAG TPA: glycosyltransferase family 39 protein [Herpetosiphonaceae bacterium]
MSDVDSAAPGGLRALAPAARRLLWAAVALGLLLRLAFALLPLSRHLMLLEDDAWMVTAIARNFAEGKGITADGVNPTNGFHPLYTLTLGALPYLFTDNLDAGFTASLLICAVLSALVMWPLWRLASHLGGERAALVAVALYALNPLAIRLTVNAMETAMALLMWTTLAWAALAWDLRSLKANLVLAALTAATILTRLDASLLFAAIAGARFLWAWRERRLRAELPLLSAYVAATFALLAPYFIRNQLVFGSLSPSSGQALVMLHSYAGSYALSNGLQAWYLNHLLPLEWLPSPLLMAALLAGLATLAWRLIGRALWRALPLWLYLLAVPIYYGYLMQHKNERYFVGFSIVLTVLAGWLIARSMATRPRWGRWAPLAALGLTAIQVVTAARIWGEAATAPSLTQPTMHAMALWVRDNLPADAVLGAKNSGIYQYYSGHTVINLDGKLNHEILPALAQRRLSEYIRSKGIAYLVDREETLTEHVMFYSAEYAQAKPHRPPALGERIGIYAALAGKSLGFGPGPALDRYGTFTVVQPFTATATIIERMERPNEARNPVVVFELK